MRRLVRFSPVQEPLTAPLGPGSPRRGTGASGLPLASATRLTSRLWRWLCLPSLLGCLVCGGVLLGGVPPTLAAVQGSDMAVAGALPALSAFPTPVPALLASRWAARSWPLLAATGPSAPSPAPPSSPAVTGSSAADLQHRFAQALAESREGRFAEALPLWDQVLELAPDDAPAWSNRGNVRLALGDPQGAIADQERAMALDPANPDPHLNRGTAEEALGRWQAAADDYDWILERDPGDASALYNLGNVQGSLGDWQAARNSFEAASAARPGFAMARSSAALAAFQLGELEGAERELRSLIRRYPLFADARAGLTALLWQRGASGEAESHWAAAAGLDPRYRQEEWLLLIRRWPPRPVAALEQFLHLES